MTLTDLRERMNQPDGGRWLRAHGRRIGEGSQRVAYRVGNYVVKANTAAWEVVGLPKPVREKLMRVPVKALRAAGLNPPATWYAGPGRTWVIQRFYGGSEQQVVREYNDWAAGRRQCRYAVSVPWTIAPGVSVQLDIFPANLGLDQYGDLVAFDW